MDLCHFTALNSGLREKYESDDNPGLPTVYSQLTIIWIIDNDFQDIIQMIVNAQ